MAKMMGGASMQEKRYNKLPGQPQWFTAAAAVGAATTASAPYAILRIRTFVCVCE